MRANEWVVEEAGFDPDVLAFNAAMDAENDWGFDVPEPERIGPVQEWKKGYRQRTKGMADPAMR